MSAEIAVQPAPCHVTFARRRPRPRSISSTAAPILLILLMVGCGATQPARAAAALPVSASAAAVREFPAYPGAVWDGDTTTQEADGRLSWLVSWTAPAAEETVRRFFMRALDRSGWQIVAGADQHRMTLRYAAGPPLKGFLRFGPPEFGEHGTGIVLGVTDPLKRPQSCLQAVPELPVYAEAALRLCELTHTPGQLNLLVFLATSDEAALVLQTYSRQLADAGWHGDGEVAGILVLRGHAGETVRLILGPDVTGRLATGIMVSIDLPEGSLLPEQI